MAAAAMTGRMCLVPKTHGHRTKEYKLLSEKFGFKYRTLHGEFMFCYVTCRPDIGYAITTLSKFAKQPSEVHYLMLKNVARYL